ncbi:family 10 glycosylhydrolase [Barnesiella propionica]|uniref:family 10 glycosylhydrolase n=1 Tax=Barnesiella propionica TaxID=2981781 RepID=UPI0011C74CBD|nr:family 10 glycosylhydrolase [Barnesiella propionica]MCU6769735.1 family 10 glycosylhydrolase [Barnesiella propionica]
MKKIGKICLFSVMLLGLSLTTVQAQSPKREFRGVWLSTVWKLTWPTATITQTGNAAQINSQKQEMIMLLDSVKNANMNSIFFQVRSRCDAMYRSSYEPWSTDLVATRGMDPGYDPLEFVVEEAHKRGIEVHAWINPYRYEGVLYQWNGTPQAYRTEHPDWLLDYPGASILNPGKPEVRNRITDIVSEIVRNYDVDGIVFDDYFYMEGTTDAMDQDLFEANNPDNLERGDWRRQNVNKMVKQVYDMIQNTKPYVKFGISPAGVWTTNASIASKYGLTPTPASGEYAYNGIYCDPVAWIQEKTIDYISPQIYWTIGSSNDYSKIAPWWSDVARRYGRHFYSSHTASGLSSAYAPSRTQGVNNNFVDYTADDEVFELNGETVSASALSQIERQSARMVQAPAATAAFKGGELVNQVLCNRDADYADAPGSVFYNTKTFIRTPKMLALMRDEVYQRFALTPAVGWKQNINPGLVDNITFNGTDLTWTGYSGMRYAIYAVPTSKATEDGTCFTSDYLVGISYVANYTLPEKYREGYTYAVSVVDRYGNEFAPRFAGAYLQTSESVTLTFPLNGANVASPFVFTWSEVPGAVYVHEVALDPDFTDVISSRELTVNKFSSFLLGNLDNSKTYYWRVKTRKPNSTDALSATHMFLAENFRVVTPETGSTEVSITPVISWTSVNSVTEYTMEISTAYSFASSNIVHSAVYTGTEVTLPVGVLVGGMTYYVRMKATVGEQTYTSEITSFTTEEAIPEVPVILSPLQNQIVNTRNVEVIWADNYLAKGFRVEIHPSETFIPIRNGKVQTISNFVYNTVFDNLTADGVYYIRVRADYGTGSYTDWSDTVKIEYRGFSAVEDASADETCFVTPGTNPNLVLKAGAKHVTAEIVDISGRYLGRFVDETDFQGEQSFRLPSLSSGVYIIIVNLDGKIKKVKLIQ